MLSIAQLKEILHCSKQLTLLYVEDNKEARESMTLMLENFFDTILVANDGEDGLQKYEQYKLDTNNYIDIVITDIEMPKLDGIGLIKKIYKTNPAQKIIVVSAYSDKSYLIPLLNIGIEGFLQKPVTSDHIANMLIDFCDGMQNSDIVIDDEYKYNKHSKELTKNNKSVELSSNEIKLLELFLDSPNRYFTLIDIFNHIFYDDPFKDYSQDSIRALLKRLRKKLPQDIIINSRTLGYTIKI